jgi:hypothetical protein
MDTRLRYKLSLVLFKVLMLILFSVLSQVVELSANSADGNFVTVTMAQSSPSSSSTSGLSRGQVAGITIGTFAGAAIFGVQLKNPNPNPSSKPNHKPNPYFESLLNLI